MSAITVGTADLRSALLAVGPHAAKDPQDATLYRVRLAVDVENVTVQATNRYSAGLALVSIEEHDGELLDIDLSCKDVGEILALFKVGKSSDGEIGDTLELATDAEHFTVTDTSGLFPGKSLRLPRVPVDENFPDLRKLAWTKLTRQHRDPVERLVTAGTLIALFRSAAEAYREPLALEMTGQNSALIVSCGESFLGFLSPSRTAAEADALMDSWRTAWLIRLEPDMAAGPAPDRSAGAT